MTTPSYHEALRGELVRATERRRRRRTTRWAGVGATIVATAAAVAVAVSLSVASPPSADTGVRVFRTPGDVTLQLTGGDADPEEIERAAREAGLDVVVKQAPTGPSQVGRFVAVAINRRAPTFEEVYANDDAGFIGVRLPTAWTGTVTLSLGRAARPGEHYAGSVNAFAKGEPLACLPLFGLSRGEAERILAGDPKTASVDVEWTGTSGPEDRVVSAQSVSPTSVTIELGPPNSRTAPNPRGC
ncbi:MAG TPA: hypothetical protein VF230_04975 [Acidimicrobiales bacterium]